MNPKIKKLRAERSKNENKIKALSARNKEIDEAITQIENSEIIGIVRATDMNLEQLAAYLKAFRNGEMPSFTLNEREDSANETEE